MGQAGLLHCCKEEDLGTSDPICVHTVEDEPPSASPGKSGCLLFRTSDGEAVAVTFPAKPVGLDFAKVMPLRVRAVGEGTIAQEKGVQIGWELEEINGQNVAAMGGC